MTFLHEGLIHWKILAPEGNKSGQPARSDTQREQEGPIARALRTVWAEMHTAGGRALSLMFTYDMGLYHHKIRWLCFFIVLTDIDMSTQDSKGH